jgi:hypothetical protein
MLSVTGALLILLLKCCVFPFSNQDVYIVNQVADFAWRGSGAYSKGRDKTYRTKEGGNGNSLKIKVQQKRFPYELRSDPSQPCAGRVWTSSASTTRKLPQVFILSEFKPRGRVLHLDDRIARKQAAMSPLLLLEVVAVTHPQRSLLWRYTVCPSNNRCGIRRCQTANDHLESIRVRSCTP